MTLFRVLLVGLFVANAIYTLLVGMEHGWNLVPVFFAEIQAMSWQGQFNFDFTSFLLLSGLWCAWRNRFSPAGLVLGVLGFTGGILFLSAYLLYLSIQSKGDLRTVMLGDRV